MLNENKLLSNVQKFQIGSHTTLKLNIICNAIRILVKL